MEDWELRVAWLRWELAQDIEAIVEEDSKLYLGAVEENYARPGELTCSVLPEVVIWYA